jgi:hypothetical protein
MEGHLPTQPMPFISADFNACGWAGDGDESFYALDRDALVAIPAQDGMLAFVWSPDEPGTILGWVATLQHVTLGAFTGWRARPLPNSFYRGPIPPNLVGALGA